MPKSGCKSALHQDAGAAERNRFINLVADFVERADVSVRRARPAVESTEGTNYVADIRVVDIAVDDVGDDVVGVSSLANFVGGRADASDIVRFKQRGAVVRRQARARQEPCLKCFESHSACS